MALENIQYDAIMREYDRRQSQNRRRLEEHREHAYRQVPRLKEIQDAIAASSAQRIRSRLKGDCSESNSAYEKKLQILSEERSCLLRENGFPPDYLDMPCECPLCRDTGYISRNKKCACFQKMAADIFYQQSGLKEILEKENFELFSFSFYSDRIRDDDTGKTPLEHAQFAVEKSQEFIRQFGNAAHNLFIYGDTGVGKTFLSHCIACEILKKAYSVLYFPSYDLFDLLAKETFSKESDSEGALEYILNCDLLILDDLGTELTNTFVSSQLFLIVNERMLRERSTIISTNKDLETFSEIYSTRTFSRIIQNYVFINLIGKDIRRDIRSRKIIQEDKRL